MSEAGVLRKLARPLQKGEVLTGNVDLIVLAVSEPMVTGQMINYGRRAIVLQELTRDEYLMARRIAHKARMLQGLDPFHWYGDGFRPDALRPCAEQPEDPPDRCCHYYQLRAIDQCQWRPELFASRTGTG